ncbi:DENN domain-containing protein 1B isoform X2 [Takifugu rubripes]|uniref:DENN domain-containing protein 1B isoform X2 n=1 Tax=Takifugu rubripes TaxID=31033 RepID=UPI001145BF1D|nr:DENN domain-containing protein 1B-like isoform X2 [Takifugu rubripes]
MGSRLKENPERTFYWFFEATCPVARDREPGVQFQFPEDFCDEESCQTLPRFCFPYDIQRVRDGVAVQHFTFVLTDLEGSQRFGFCRLTTSTHTCLCILSYLPWFEVFYKLLNNLADYLKKGQINEMKALLAVLYKQPIPMMSGSVALQMGDQLVVSKEVSHHGGHPEGHQGIPYFIAPDPRSLPSIPENRNLTELIVAVDVGNLLQLYASMLLERRILIFASKLSTLTSCVHALSAVLYPMYWQHIFIPVLPPHLLDYCCAPMPYLIGVHTSLSEKVRGRALEEVVILNVDSNTLETPFDDLKKIPSDVVSGLKVCLKRQAVSPGCGVSRAFLKAQALLFGGYRDALQGQHDGEMVFNEEVFLEHKSSSMRQFLQSAVHLQFFKQFIDSRLDILSKGKEPDDLFEEEIQNCDTTDERRKSSKSYQQLVNNLKKGGVLIHNMKYKANLKANIPLTKSGLKNLLMHKAHREEKLLHRGGSVSHRRAQSDCLQNRLPITQHFGKKAVGDMQDVTDTSDPWNRAASRPAMRPKDELQMGDEEDEESLLSDPEEMDLLGEIFDTLSTRNLHERGPLYGTRSLDLFGSDSNDFITKYGFPSNPSQESLTLSMSGSGSLHSWNLETPEEKSASDWSHLEESVREEDAAESPAASPEKQGQKCGQMEETKQESVKEVIDGNQEEEEIEDSNNGEEEGKGEEERRASDEIGVSSGEDGNKPEVEELKENGKEKENQITEEDSSCEMMKEAQEAPQQRGEREEKEKTEVSPPHQNTAKQRQEQDAGLETADLQSRVTDEPPQKVSDEAEKRPPLPAPKVLSAVTRLQSQADSQAKEAAENRTSELLQSSEKVQTPANKSKQKSSEEEEEPPLIKVSELKKRFEA